MVAGLNGPTGQHAVQIVGVIVVELAILLLWKMGENIAKAKILCLIIALVGCVKVCRDFIIRLSSILFLLCRACKIRSHICNEILVSSMAKVSIAYQISEKS